MQKFSQIIHGSLEWAVAVTFRPFQPKKWLILGFVALMAGYVAGGSHINLPNFPSRDRDTKIESQASSPAHTRGSTAQNTPNQPEREFKQFIEQVKEQIKNPLVIAIIIAVILFLLIFIILMVWLCSRFSFIFLDDVARNDASIRAPFGKHKVLGNSLFLFSLVMGIISIILLGIIGLMFYLFFIKSGLFNHPTGWAVVKITLGIISLGAFFLAFIFIAALISVITRDFVLIVMLKDKIKIMPAWKKALGIIKSNKMNIFIYLLLKFGLAIVSSFIYTALFLGAMLGIVMTFVPITLILVLAYQVIPAAGQMAYLIILAIVLVPALIFLWYCALCAYLPFAVFFRTFSMKFMARLAPEYNLFKSGVIL